MTQEILPLIIRINSIEQRIRDLSEEKQGLEKELNCFLVADDGVKDLRVRSSPTARSRRPSDSGNR
jgi:hypothetical protein